jgi:hypothetical protein
MSMPNPVDMNGNRLIVANSVVPIAKPPIASASSVKAVRLVAVSGGGAVGVVNDFSVRGGKISLQVSSSAQAVE